MTAPTLPPPPLSGSQGTSAPVPRRTSGSSTVTRLRLATWVTVAIAVLFAVVASTGIQRRDNGIADARVAAQRLLDVQAVRVSIVAADSIASTNYLRGGLERSDARQAFDENIRNASVGLAAASNGMDADDAAALSAASADLTAYTGLIEQARANNRQGYPVGAAYQRQANALITSSTLPLLDRIESSLRGQVNEAMSTAGSAAVWFWIALVVLLAALAVGLRWLAQRFKRLVNVPLAAAGALVVIVGMFAGLTAASSMSQANSAVEGHLRVADLSAQTRAALLDARSQEALTLINRGNGAAFERSWQQSMATAELAAQRSCPRECGLIPALDRYRRAHVAMRQSDDAGEWDRAVAQALNDSDVEGQYLVSDFNDVERAVQAQLASSVNRADLALDEARNPLGWVRWLMVLLGLGVAALAIAGYGQRSREYR